jgi:hypothetical protein
MSPELRAKGYEIQARPLPGEKAEDHEKLYRTIRTANDFLRGWKSRLVTKGEFIRSSALNVLAGVIKRPDAVRFTDELLDNKNPVIHLTRDKDSESNDPYIVEWKSDKIGE